MSDTAQCSKNSDCIASHLGPCTSFSYIDSNNLAFLKQADLAPFNLTEPVMINLIRFQISCLYYRTFSSALLHTLHEKSTLEYGIFTYFL